MNAANPANMPGLDVSSRVRARDIQMAGVADLRRRVLMISGAIDTTDHDISLCVNLPEPGRWQIIKSTTNLTDQTWAAIQVTTDEESSFVDDEDNAVISRQFTKTFMTPDQRRLTFYDGEVRPGESLLKMSARLHVLAVQPDLGRQHGDLGLEAEFHGHRRPAVPAGYRADRPGYGHWLTIPRDDLPPVTPAAGVSPSPAVDQLAPA